VEWSVVRASPYRSHPGSDSKIYANGDGDPKPCLSGDGDSNYLLYSRRHPEALLRVKESAADPKDTEFALKVAALLAWFSGRPAADRQSVLP
jgi:hypothetical protein